MPGIVFKKVNRLPSNIITEFAKLPSSIISDAQGRNNTMDASIKPLRSDWKMIGSAITVKAMVGNNLGVHQALYLAKEGDIIVVDGNGFENIAMWGGIMTEIAVKRKLAGLVVDGSIRDVESAIELNFPIFSRSISPRGPHKGWGDDVNVPISCGGVPVLPGDIILGDSDGIVVVHKRFAVEVLKHSKERIEMEKRWTQELKDGKTTFEVIGLNKNVEFFSIREFDEAFDD